MSKKTVLPLDDDDMLEQRISETARQRGIPSLTPTPVVNAAQTEPRRPIKVEVSDALFQALTIAAAQQRVTKRFLILSALRNAGYPIDGSDFLEDGRRVRGSRKI